MCSVRTQVRLKKLACRAQCSHERTRPWRESCETPAMLDPCFTRHWLRLLQLFVGVLGACSQPMAAASHSAPSTATQLAAPGVAAEAYTSLIPSGPVVSGEEPGPVERALARASMSSHQQLTGDPRLARLASWAAGQLTSGAKLPPQAALDWAARHLGLIEPSPHFVLLAGSDQAAVATGFEDRLRASLSQQAYSHWGGAALERHGLVIYAAALSFRFLEQGAVPREMPLGSSIALSGKLTHGYVTPLLAVTRPDGAVTRGDPGVGATYKFRVPTDARGVYRVELFGEGPRGIAPIANFPVYVGSSPQNSIEVSAAGDEPPVRDMRVAAQRLLELANAERARVGLTPLVMDARLAAVADAHVADMLAHHYVAHTSETTGTPAQRVERAGIRSGMVLENIGRATSLSDVHAGLMDSPGHRGALLSPLATHVGIAVRRVDETAASDYLVTQVFIRVTPELASDAPSQLLASINRVREKAERRPLRADAALSDIAAKAARRCFGGAASDSSLLDGVHADLQRASQSRGVQSVSMILGESLDDLAQLEALRAADAQRIGLGVFQGDRPDALPNTLCAVFVLAR